MHIKTILRFYLTPVRIAIIKTPPTTNVGKDAGEKGSVIHWCWKCKLVQPLWKTKHRSAI
jgi:hypothetical protein